MPEPLMVSITDVSVMLKLNRRTVYRLIEDGELRCVKLRGTRRVPIADVLRLAGLDPFDTTALVAVDA